VSSQYGDYCTDDDDDSDSEGDEPVMIMTDKDFVQLKVDNTLAPMIVPAEEDKMKRAIGETSAHYCCCC